MTCTPSASENAAAVRRVAAAETRVTARRPGVTSLARQHHSGSRESRPRGTRSGRSPGYLHGALALLFLATLVAAQVQAPSLAATDAAELTLRIDRLLALDAGSRPVPKGRAVLVPQLGDPGAMAVAGRGFAYLQTDVDRVVLVALRAAPAVAKPAGAVAAAAGIALPTCESMRTPIGEVRVDAEAMQACRSRSGFRPDVATAAAEETVLAALPFLQRLLPKGFRIVPLAVDAGADPTLLTAMVEPLLNNERTAVAVITGLPFGPGDFDSLFAATEAPTTAPPASAPLLALRSLATDMGWRAVVAGHGQTTDGRACLAAVLVEDPNRIDLLVQASRAAWDDPATLAAFQDAGRASGRTNFQGDLLSQPEQQLLLSLARKTIYCKIKGEALPTAPLYSDTLSAPSGCFVTLNLAGKLRGCIGTILPKEALAVAVQHYAQAAAFEDKRFEPVTLEELAAIEIEISALTVPTKVDFRDAQELLGKLTPGVHGVLLTAADGKRVTFLPQVWGQVPDKAAFLTALCRKGGIPLDAWQDPAKSTVELYESFNFSDKPK